MCYIEVWCFFVLIWISIFDIRLPVVVCSCQTLNWTFFHAFWTNLFELWGWLNAIIMLYRYSCWTIKNSSLNFLFIFQCFSNLKGNKTVISMCCYGLSLMFDVTELFCRVHVFVQPTVSRVVSRWSLTNNTIVLWISFFSL